MRVISGRSLYFLFFLSILLLLSSFTKAGTIAPLTQSNLSKIKKIAIFVTEDEEFDFDLETQWRPPDNSIIDILGTFKQFYQQEKFEESLEAKLPKPSSIMADKLKHSIELSDARVTAEIPDIKSRSMLKARGFDAILEVNLKDWGLDVSWKDRWWHYDPEEKEIINQWNTYKYKQGSAKQFLYSEDAFHLKDEELEDMERAKNLLKEIDFTKVKVWIQSSGRMFLIDYNTTMWEGVVIYKDENSYSPADFTRQPTLFIDILARAINNLAENTVNEIL